MAGTTETDPSSNPPAAVPVNDVESEGISAGEVEDAMMEEADAFVDGPSPPKGGDSKLTKLCLDASPPLTSLIRGIVEEV